MKFDDYLRLRHHKETTIIAYTHAVRQLLDYVDKMPEDITQNDVDEFILHIKQKYAHNTLINKTSSIKWFMQYLNKKDIEIKVPHFKPTSKSVLSEEEILSLFKATENSPINNAILKVFYYTGIRKSELIGLELTDVNLEQDLLYINKAKRDITRTVFLAPECKKAIQRYLGVRLQPIEGNPLFVSIQRKRFTAGGIDYLVHTIASNAGIKKKVHPHLFRASIITHMHNRGASIKEIQAISGHKRVETLLLYVRLDEDELRKAYLNSIPTFDKPTPEPSKPDIKPPEPKQPTLSKDDKLIQLYRDGLLEKQDFLALMGINQTDIAGYV